MEIAGTVGGRMIADVSKMPHTRATLTANLAAESENNLLLGELLPARAEH